MPDDVQITYGQDEYSAQAVIPGPLYLEVVRLVTVQPKGSFNYDNVIEKGEEFDIMMRVLFRDVLSQLQVKFIAHVNVLNMETGNKAGDYSFMTVGQLPGGGVKSMTLRRTLTATETGVFVMSGDIGFPTSKLFDFTLGSIAGSEPPIPTGNLLRIANFYVYDRKKLPFPID
jgi:hypothetical protein